jgi:hypothetical protein
MKRTVVYGSARMGDCLIMATEKLQHVPKGDTIVA